MITAPQTLLETIDTVIKTQFAHEDYAIILISAQAPLSFLIGKVEAVDGASVHISTARWVRYDTDWIGILPLPKVLILKASAGLWEARSGKHNRVLDWPSLAPYPLHFIPEDTFGTMVGWLAQLKVATFRDAAVKLFEDDHLRWNPINSKFVARRDTAMRDVPLNRRQPISSEYRVP
jgi:hypothetical protein